MGPEYLGYQGWNRFRIDDKLAFTVHPDLPYVYSPMENSEAVLLGYAIDPYEPELSDKQIVRRFSASTMTIDDIVSALERITGRFVLVIKNLNGLWIFHDAGALRQVHYCRDKTGNVWCASQPEVLSEHLGYEQDEEVLSYLAVPAYKTIKEEFWLVNDRTLYRQIRCLLPNHYLDLHQAKAMRYWPIPGSITPLTVKDSIRLSTPILQNSIRAAASRFDLRMGITAGCDSRKTLAATKGITDMIFFFTYTPTRGNSVDMEIPARLLPNLGITHHKLQKQSMSVEFEEYYIVSASLAREKKGHNAYTILSHFGSEATILSSNISEFSQCPYWLPKSKIDGVNLATVYNHLNHSFATSELQKWVEGARSACQAAKMNIMDLFYLEQRTARWVSAALAEYDIAHETFIPYNNRHLHCLMLAVDERYRRNRQLGVPIQHMNYMWPEVLKEPINPPETIMDKFYHFLHYSIIHRFLTPWMPVYECLKYINYRKKFRRSYKV